MATNPTVVNPRAGISMSPQQHVEYLFLRDLNRKADEAGKQFWTERAMQVPPAQLNAEFRAAAKTENPKAGSLPTRASGITLPGDPGYQEYRNKSFFEMVAPFVIPVVAVVAPQFLPAIGKALGATGAAATAVGAGVVNAGITAGLGGSPEDIVKAGLAAGGGMYAGSVVGEAVKGAQQAGTLSGTLGGNAALPAVAGSAVGAGTGTLIQTGDPGKAGLAALGAGAGQAIGGAALDVLPDDANLTLKSGLASAAGGATEAAVTGQDVGASALVSGLAGAGQDYIQRRGQRPKFRHWNQLHYLLFNFFI